MTAFSCAVIGDESLLIGCCDTMLERGHAIRTVITRNAEITRWAKTKGLPVSGGFDGLPEQVDWLFSIANLRVIPETALAHATKGAINFHDGPLPRYAGLNTPAWARMAGETEHGVTWHLIEGGIDEGDILAQRLFEIVPEDTAFSLNSKCYGAGLESFSEVLEQLESGALRRQKQDLSQRSYRALADRPDAAGRIDFTKSADEIAALVRGLDFGEYWNPLGLPKVELDGAILSARSVTIEAPATDAAPGTVLNVTKESVTVATGTAPITLNRMSDLAGGAVDLATFVSSGQVLAGKTSAAALNDAIHRSAPGKAFWRKRMQTLHPLPCPLARKAGEAPHWESHAAVLPTLTPDQAMMAAALWALLSSGEEHGDVAYASQAVAQVAADLPGYMSPWVPLQLARSGDTLAEIAERVEQTRAKAEATGGFVADLGLRDPAITQSATPGFGIGPAPIRGTAITATMDTDTATLHYDSTRLTREAVVLLADRLSLIAGHLAGAPDTTETPDAIPHLPETERTRLLEAFNQTDAAYDATQTIHAAFEAQVARTPEATALVCEHDTLSYAELDARANRIAHVLRDMGVGAGAHVGLSLARSTDLVAGALGILKAGGAYVPLDPAYPADRLAHYVKDSAAQVIVTASAQEAVLPATDAARLVLDSDARLDAAPATTHGGTAGPEDLAYLIYTSGSTGLPKGVMVEHRNVANFFAGMDARVPHGPGDTWLAVTSLAFDISVLELFYTLARGFKVVLSSDENRAVVSNGPIRMGGKPLNFNLFYWGNDDGAGPKKYELLLEGAKFADAHGFNAVWTPERHFHAFGGPYPNPSVTGAAVAAVTQNLSVRAGSCVAPLHHPARIAEEWSVIDNLTNGRAGLAIASGWQPDDFILRPENTPPANKPAMFEAIETLRKLWRGEAVGFPTQSGEMHEVITQPRPVSKDLPVWVTTAGNPETWREAGRIGANVLTHLLGQSVAEVGEKIAIYHEALREAGHDPEDFQVTLMLHTYLAETRETARDIAREPMKDYLRSAAGLIKQYAWAFPAFKRPEGATNPFDVDLGSLGEDEMEAILDFAFERYFEESGLFGTVEDAVARAEEVRRIGVTEVACLIDYGIAPDVVLEGLEPLAKVLEAVNAPAELDDEDVSIAAQMVRHRVSHLQCTPSMGRMIAMNDDARLALSGVKHVLLGGEALPGDLVTDLRRCTRAQVLNMYGPTETTIWSTVEAVGAEPEATVSVGTPIANTQVYVLDPQSNPVPIGVPGELFIGGDGVTRGYWQRAELTAERFVENPFGPGRLYGTGDLVRWDAEGRLDFLGRTDHQVKIRGQRIELGEIEAAMADFKTVTQAVVIAKEVNGDTRLVGYVTASADVDEDAMRTQLAARLPEVMVPAHIVTLDTFPLTPNKKIDRKALPDPELKRAPARTIPTAPPKAGLEQDIAAIWSRILGVGDIRAEDNFFALGGHSLLAVQAHREIKADLGLSQLSITDIFRFPTLGGLAAHLGNGAAQAEPAPEVAAPARAETMSKRRAMRANRGARSA
ncbi:MupA/Atu3671 family FMN-dependent luciferase-like monooxygenase [Thalassococcus sp. S3]|uniref:MupA/Atu3671 family FMN-dependent luciferase-like monooxygenase n=1 Tax=Thalassococcus sp. S3 TaxID=2017482 RepID=UPI001023F4DF|nr:MupA/Atu3671 family FMN-dependent luciferase-like monooxygenase [Thalassococcus sp. S3]QBF31986.1 peptide synthetase [Thalassococcus sp. S3]